MNDVNVLRAHRVAFIGAGHMAEALVKGLVESGRMPTDALRVTDVRPERREYFERTFGVRGLARNDEAAAWATIVVLAVKPQSFGEALAGLRDAFGPGRLAVSIAAGLTTGRIERALGDGARVVRVMPNTPALVRAGVSALCAGRWATEDDLGAAEAVMTSVGLAVRVEERLMDAVTAVSGSGPAYVFYLAEAMIEAGRQLGLDEGLARRLTAGTLDGAARLLAASEDGPAVLRARVTSKGGTTEAAIRVLDGRGAGAALIEAIRAAHRRAGELAGG